MQTQLVVSDKSTQPLTNRFLHSAKEWGPVIAGVGLYLLSMLLVWLDKEFNLRWVNVGLWLSSLICTGWGLRRLQKAVEQASEIKKAEGSPSRIELFSYPALIIVTFVVYTFYINVYPFSSIGDELRDTALFSAGITRGEVRNLFGYGSYSSYGLIIPILTTPLYWLFGPSVLVIRLGACIVGLLNIFLLYRITRKFLGVKVTTWATIILIGLPLHLYYARTEVVVLFTAFWFLVLLYCFGKLFEQPSVANYGWLGLVCGITLNFHASAKAIALTSLLLVLGYSLLVCLQKRQPYKNLPSRLGLLCLMVLVGFGPIILFTPAEVFFQTAKTAPSLAALPNNIGNNPLSNGLEQVGHLLENYPKSLLVYFYEPTFDHYHDHKSILPFVLGLFFVIGLVQALLSKHAWLRLLGIFALTIPLTNSVLTDLINADRRLTALLPLSAILTAYGAAQVGLRLAGSPRGRVTATLFFTALFTLTSCLTTYNFFNQEAASYGMYRHDDAKVYQDYLVTYTIKGIQTTNNLQSQKSVCLHASKDTLDYLKLVHIQEQYKYFLPNLIVEFKTPTDFPDDRSIYVAPGCHNTLNEMGWKGLNYCNPYEKYACPPDRNRFFVFVPL